MIAGIVRWICGEMADKGLEYLLRNRKFNQEIEKVVKVWAKSLRGENYVDPAVFFGVITNTGDDAGGKYLVTVQEKLLKHNWPEKNEWQNAFVERWLYIRKNVEEPQAFFIIEQAQAEAELERLAESIYGVCKQYAPAFQTAVIDKLDGMDAVLEQVRDTIDSRVVTVTPTSVRLHSGEWEVQTPIIVTNLGSLPAYCVVLKILIHGQGVTASSLKIEADPQVPPLEAAIGDIIVSADQLRLNCSSKDGQQIVLFILHTVPAKGNRTISIKGTVSVDSSANVEVVNVDEKPQEILTRQGQELAILFKPTEDVIVNGVGIKMSRKK